MKVNNTEIKDIYEFTNEELIELVNQLYYEIKVLNRALKISCDYAIEPKHYIGLARQEIERDKSSV